MISELKRAFAQRTTKVSDAILVTERNAEDLDKMMEYQDEKAVRRLSALRLRAVLRVTKFRPNSAGTS